MSGCSNSKHTDHQEQQPPPNVNQSSFESLLHQKNPISRTNHDLELIRDYMSVHYVRSSGSLDKASDSTEGEVEGETANISSKRDFLNWWNILDPSQRLIICRYLKIYSVFQENGEDFYVSTNATFKKTMKQKSKMQRGRDRFNLDIDSSSNSSADDNLYILIRGSATLVSTSFGQQEQEKNHDCRNANKQYTQPYCLSDETKSSSWIIEKKSFLGCIDLPTNVSSFIHIHNSKKHNGKRQKVSSPPKRKQQQFMTHNKKNNDINNNIKYKIHADKGSVWLVISGQDCNQHLFWAISNKLCALAILQELKLEYLLSMSFKKQKELPSKITCKRRNNKREKRKKYGKCSIATFPAGYNVIKEHDHANTRQVKYCFLVISGYCQLFKTMSHHQYSDSQKPSFKEIDSFHNANTNVGESGNDLRVNIALKKKNQKVSDRKAENVDESNSSTVENLTSLSYYKEHGGFPCTLQPYYQSPDKEDGMTEIQSSLIITSKCGRKERSVLHNNIQDTTKEKDSQTLRNSKKSSSLSFKPNHNGGSLCYNISHASSSHPSKVINMNARNDNTSIKSTDSSFEKNDDEKTIRKRNQHMLHLDTIGPGAFFTNHQQHSSSSANTSFFSVVTLSQVKILMIPLETLQEKISIHSPESSSFQKTFDELILRQYSWVDKMSQVYNETFNRQPSDENIKKNDMDASNNEPPKPNFEISLKDRVKVNALSNRHKFLKESLRLLTGEGLSLIEQWIEFEDIYGEDPYLRLDEFLVISSSSDVESSNVTRVKAVKDEENSSKTTEINQSIDNGRDGDDFFTSSMINWNMHGVQLDSFLPWEMTHGSNKNSNDKENNAEALYFQNPFPSIIHNRQIHGKTLPFIQKSIGYEDPFQKICTIEFYRRQLALMGMI